MGQTSSQPSFQRRPLPFLHRFQHGTALQQLEEREQTDISASRTNLALTQPLSMPSNNYPSESPTSFTSPPSSQRDIIQTSNTRLQRNPSRLRRARTSLSISLPGVFRRTDATRYAPSSTEAVSSVPERPPTSPEEGNSSAPQTAHSDSDVDLDSLSYNRYTGSRLEPRPATSDDTRRLRDHRPMSSLANRISSLTPDRGFRQMIRRRRSPARAAENDDTAMLTRMLSVAAAATAASLVGSDSEEAFQDIARTAGIEGDDGAFATFLHTLRTGRLNTLLSQDADSPAFGPTVEDNVPPPAPPNGLQFFRVFRFGGQSAHESNDSRPSESAATPVRPALASSSSSASSSAAPAPAVAENRESTSDSRMIPVLMIGIRSLHADDEQRAQTGDGMPSFLDALANFPPADAPQLFNGNNNTNNSAARLARNGVNFSQRRRASVGALGLLRGSSRERQRRIYRNTHSLRPLPAANAPDTASLTLPNEPGSSRTITPSPSLLSPPELDASVPRRRASVSSIGARPLPTQQDLAPRPSRTPLGSTIEDLPSPRPTRARRLSDSEFTRYGSGSSRRNGVVEPDRTSTSTDRETNRSWIIYVLGGNYPENHPILMTPSLFTDSPSYEDMLLLSSLLGPAKPPVASSEEVSAAGGLFQTKVGDHGLQLVGGDPIERVPLPPGEQCLVCLCDFGQREVVRRLNKCKHLFHQECIDQWLTTGRNACPLCRQQGVDETPAQRTDEEAASPTAAPTAS